MAEGFTTVPAAAVGNLVAASGEATQSLLNFWPQMQQEIKEMSPTEFKNQELPLARIKKIMKLDEDVKMISQEAPVVFARATEMFISELTLRSWIHTEENKRRTLQRNDIAMAISKYDQFDFLIDIVPRDELKPPKRPDDTTQRTAMMPDQVQYYFQLAQQHQAAISQSAQPVNNTQQQQPQQPQPQQVQLQVVNQQQQQQQQQILQQPVQLQLANSQVGQAVSATSEVGQPQVIQVQSAQALQQAQQPATQVIHQIVTPSGEVQNVPIQLTAAQLQSLQLQVQGQRAGQPIVLQTAGNVQTQQIQTVQHDQQQQQQPLFQIQQLPFTTNGQQTLQQVFQLPAATMEENQDVGDGS